MRTLQLPIVTAMLLLAARYVIALPVSIPQTPYPQASPSNYESVFPRALSPKARHVFDAVMQTAKKYPERLTSPIQYLPTAGRVLGFSFQHSPNDTLCEEFITNYAVKAQEEVVLETFLYDRKSLCARQMADAVRTLDAKAKASGTRIRVYILVDTAGLLAFIGSSRPGTSGVVNALFKYYKLAPEALGLPRVRDVPNLDLRVKTFHRWPLGALHSKTLAVDGRLASIGSKNIDTETGLDMLIGLEGPIAQSVRADFFQSWNEPAPVLRTPAPHTTSDMVPMVVAANPYYGPFLGPPEDTPQNVAWKAAMDAATHKAFIMTPNFSTDSGREMILRTLRRGVKVDLVELYGLDLPQFVFPPGQSDGSNMLAMLRLFNAIGNDTTLRSRLRVCWYMSKRFPVGAKPSSDDWTHVKYMSIDDEFAIVGSGNQDAQSWYHSQEFNILIDDAAITRQINQALDGVHRSFDPCHHV
ncbi:hypothetical protein THASP1DRAFT_21813 [Thamnocephalis sphaerospora]|uniref:PLD phosphodiesterase domain-containing protein n=1 Tax=Thamnocephalis sphaerospora TaxID=78915 RepID=A0A4P9XW07_9FUNG|nr:hypothetical protein THASP1DRAFT_21813 [Thamnocephalis sphaerospora]|eukprot:RKP10493.1 hypothetical protein THASP1DRAFT_21813 [Thamnocephalis sphaerospora]